MCISDTAIHGNVSIIVYESAVSDIHTRHTMQVNPYCIFILSTQNDKDDQRKNLIIVINYEIQLTKIGMKRKRI